MALPPGWDTGTDATGRIYYVNHGTQQTQWEPPTEGGGPGMAMAPPPGYGMSQEKGVTDPQVLPQAAAVHATAVPPAHNSIQQPYPVQQQPGQPSTVVVLQPGLSGVPHNAPQGGVWIQEKYCGIITWLVGIFMFPCVCCCPCDDRPIYIVNGTRYNKYGAIVPQGCC
ncbi:unnamed protein product [Scytosiphon promiscuus]